MTTPNEFAANLTLANANLERLDSAINDAPGTYLDKDAVAIPNLRSRLDSVETSATASAAAAAASETAAAASETAAAASETAAAASETAAAASETSALASANAALAALDSFDDRYLGAFATDPTLDNDGNTLVAGALYFDTVNELMNVYTGTVWVDVGVSPETIGTAFTRTLLDDSDAGEARTTLDVYSKSEVDGQALGVGQTWTDVTGSRPLDTTFTNTTGRVIQISVTCVYSADGLDLLVGGVVASRHETASGTGIHTVTMTAIVPVGATYRADVTAGAPTLDNWSELT